MTMAIALIVSDMISLLLAFRLAIFLTKLIVGNFLFIEFWQGIAVVSFFLLVYAINGLYPGVGLSPVIEMKQLFRANNIVNLILIAISYWEQSSEIYSRFFILTAWILVVIFVQTSRWLTRIVGRKIGFWGEPVAIVGSGPQTEHIVQFLKDRMRLGLIPHLVVDGFASYEKSALAAINYSKIRTVILVISEMSSDLQKRFIDDQRYGFHRRRGETNILHMIMISTLGWVGSLGIIPYDLDGTLGLEIRQNLLNKWPNFVKRFIDIALTVLSALIASPVLIFNNGFNKNRLARKYILQPGKSWAKRKSI